MLNYLLANRETTTMVKRLVDQLINRTEIIASHSGKLDHTIVVIVPAIIPASTPDALVLFHHNNSNNAGPKDAPRPDHA